MPSARLEQRRKELENDVSLLKIWLESGFTDDVSTARKIFTEYLAVSGYGVIESEMKNMLNVYVAKQATPEIAALVSQFLATEYSWDYAKIREILRRFDPSWSEKAKANLTDQQKSSINGLKSTRNKIAHGAPYDEDFEDVKIQFENSIQALQSIFDIIHENDSQSNPMN